MTTPHPSESINALRQGCMTARIVLTETGPPHRGIAIGRQRISCRHHVLTGLTGYESALA